RTVITRPSSAPTPRIFKRLSANGQVGHQGPVHNAPNQRVATRFVANRRLSELNATDPSPRIGFVTHARRGLGAGSVEEISREPAARLASVTVAVDPQPCTPAADCIRVRAARAANIWIDAGHAGQCS